MVLFIQSKNKWSDLIDVMILLFLIFCLLYLIRFLTNPAFLLPNCKPYPPVELLGKLICLFLFSKLKEIISSTEFYWSLNFNQRFFSWYS